MVENQTKVLNNILTSPVQRPGSLYVFCIQGSNILAAIHIYRLCRLKLFALISYCTTQLQNFIFSQTI